MKTLFEHHRDKRLYKTYRDQGLCHGPGVIGGGRKSVIGQRLKELGMFWTQAGAARGLSWRLALKSNRWDECWERINNSDYLKVNSPPEPRLLCGHASGAHQCV